MFSDEEGWKKGKLPAEAKLRVISVELELIPKKSCPFQRFEINLKAVWKVKK